MENEELKQAFLQWIGEHWDEEKKKLERYCADKRIYWDEDIFSDTVLKMAERIGQKGLIDSSERGLRNYLFKAFKRNVVRERQYSRNAMRDNNVENVSQLYEDWCNTNMLSSEEKLRLDMKQDFSILYLANLLLEQFGGELTHIFLEKYYYKLTYKQLSDKYHIPRLRDKLLEMKRFLQDNVTKAEIDEAFTIKYKSLY